MRVNKYVFSKRSTVGKRDYIVSLIYMVNQRIHYAILLRAFRAQRGLEPAYITNLLHERATHVLLSATNNDLYVPPSRSQYGDKTFSVSAPRMWTALPHETKTISCLVTFKRLLKTHLSRVAYAS